MVLPVSPQYRGQPFVQYRGHSRISACCVATMGYFLLLLVGAAAVVVVVCRAIKVNFALLLNNKTLGDISSYFL